VVGLECFGYQQTFSKFFSKPVQSYALDALDGVKYAKKTQISSESIRRFLEGVQKAPGKSHPSLGLGGVEMCMIDGPSGFEGKVAHRMKQEMEPFVDRVEIDFKGNLIAVAAGGHDRL